MSSHEAAHCPEWAAKGIIACAHLSVHALVHGTMKPSS